MDMKGHELSIDELDHVSGGGPVETAYQVMGAVGAVVTGLVNAGAGALGGASSGGGSHVVDKKYWL
jgi:bacteriocin-like protein